MGFEGLLEVKYGRLHLHLNKPLRYFGLNFLLLVLRLWVFFSPSFVRLE